MSCSTTAKDISASKSFESRCDQRPNKKADSFMKKLPEELHCFIKEAEPEKKKKKSV